MALSEQIAMVFVVFALLGGLAWFTKKRGLTSLTLRRNGKPRRLELLERVQLTPHHALHLVRVAGKTVLIATAPSACMLLETPAAKEPPFPFEQDFVSAGQ